MLWGAAAALMLCLQPAAALADNLQQELPLTCRDEWQRVMCSEIPSAETQELAECCLQHRTRRNPPPTAAVMHAGRDVPRPDLAGESRKLSDAPDWRFGQCTEKQFAVVPEFERAEDGHVTKVSLSGSGSRGMWLTGPVAVD